MKTVSKTVLGAIVVCCVGMTGVAQAASVDIDWKGITWDYNDVAGGAVVNGSGALVLTPTSGNLTLHTNRISTAVTNSNTPWFEVSWNDTGDAAHKIEAYNNDEVDLRQPLVGGGSLWSASKVAYARWYDADSAPRTRQEAYTFFEDPRAAVSHTLRIGKLADGNVWFGFDGEWRLLTAIESDGILDSGGVDWGFKDQYLRVRSADGATVEFTDFQYGDNFSAAMVPVPAAAWAGLLLIGGLGGVSGLRRKLRRA
jgi:hypothetical protein